MRRATAGATMRVTYLSAVGALGGAERCLIDMARLTSESAIKCAAVLLDDGPLVGELRRIGVETLVLPLPEALSGLGDSDDKSRAATIRRLISSSPQLFSYIRELRKAIAATNPTIVHSNGFKTHLLSRFASPNDARMIWHMHDFVSNRPLMRVLLRAAVKRSVEIVAVSRAVAADVTKVCPDAKTVCIYNAIDCDLFTPGTAPTGWLEQRAGLQPPDDARLNVGLVATYARWKGHDIFIRAIAQLPAAVRAMARFYIVGGPIYRTSGSQWQESELRGLVAQAVAPDIRFIPFQPDPWNVFRALDVVVHASTQPEPFGRTIVEAMASGCAVIAAPTGGAAELFLDGETAIAAASNCPDSLTNALGRLLSEPSLRKQLGAAGREAAVRRYSLPRLWGELARLYRTTSLSP